MVSTLTRGGAHSLVGYDDASPYLCPVSKMQEKEIESGKMIKFAVWRDPVERLVSCYKHFCLEKANRFYFRYLALFEDNSFDRFMEFVRSSCVKAILFTGRTYPQAIGLLSSGRCGLYRSDP